jgi:hypothetical protein
LGAIATFAISVFLSKKAIRLHQGDSPFKNWLGDKWGRNCHIPAGLIWIKVGDLKQKAYFCNPIFDCLLINTSSCLRERFNPPFAREEINMVFGSECQRPMAAVF